MRRQARPSGCIRVIGARDRGPCPGGRSRRPFAADRLAAALAPAVIAMAATTTAAAEEGHAVRWWDDAALAAPSAERLARLSVACDVSGDQLVRWFDALDAQAEAIERLRAGAAEAGPVVFPAGADTATMLRLQIEVAERRSRTRIAMEPLRDALLADLIVPLTEPQADRAILWRNLVLLEPALASGEARGWSVPTVFVEASLAEVPADRAARTRLGEIASATADTRRALVVAVGTRDGGGSARLTRRILHHLEAGLEYPAAFQAALDDPDDAMAALARDGERYRDAVLSVLRTIAASDLPAAVALEARARILARADANVGRSASIVAGAARLLATDLPEDRRLELRQGAEASLEAILDHVRDRGKAATEEATWMEAIEAMRAPSWPLARRVREHGGSIPDLPVSMNVIMRATDAEAGGATGRLGPAAVMTRAVTALAPALGLEADAAAEVATRILEGAAVGEVIPADPAGGRARTATALLEAVAATEATLEAAAAARAAPGAIRGAVDPGDRWADVPVVPMVLAASPPDAWTTEDLERFLAFERRRRANLASVPSPPAGLDPADGDPAVRERIGEHLNALDLAARERAEMVDVLLADVAARHPEVHAAVTGELDERRIGWMVRRHRELEALLAEVEDELRIGPERRLALREAGAELRAIARRVDPWLAGDTDAADPRPGDWRLVPEYERRQRAWRRHALAPEIVRWRRELLGAP